MTDLNMRARNILNGLHLREETQLLTQATRGSSIFIGHSDLEVCGLTQSMNRWRKHLSN